MKSLVPNLRLALLALVLAYANYGSAGDLRSALLTPGQGSVPTLLASTATRQFYAARNYAPVWINNPSRLETLKKAIGSASDHGLTPNSYHLHELSIEKGDRLELLATDAWLSLAAGIVGGQLNPVTIEPDWTAVRRERDLAAHLAAAITDNRIGEALEELEPDAPAYSVLKKELRSLRSGSAPERTTHIPDGAALKSGMRAARVSLLRTRLAEAGFPTVSADTDLFDPSLLDAVRTFQQNAGLKDDGIAGAATLRLLNINRQERERALIINMERWRWLPEALGERHIRVNIADFSLEARNRGTVEKSLPVIVGRDYRQTPVFSDAVSYMVVNPWWETPSSIARKDKLPDFQKDPGKVRSMGFEVRDPEGNILDPDKINWKAYRTTYLPLRLRQRPGPQNALGQVKMMFPNPHNVYLHDTPSKELFSKTERAFSSGCVRVKNATELAAWLLEGNPGADKQTLSNTLESGKETRINLTKRVPVHFLYFTVVVTPEGGVRYLNDIYKRDERIALALEAMPT